VIPVGPIATRLLLVACSIFMALVWPFVTWRRISDIGIRKIPAGIYLAAVLACWCWPLVEKNNCAAAMGLFVALELPIAILKSRANPGVFGPQAADR
jgi:hypothetical protein